MVGYQGFDPNLSTNFNNNLAKILSKGSFNESMKLPPPPKPKVMDFVAGLPGMKGPDLGSIGSGGGNLEKLMRAIRSQESGGNYGAVNRDSGAMGAYQIMPFNLNSWSQSALGHSVSRGQFMSNPQIQDAIARWQLGNYLKKYGAAGAAVAWYGGPGAVSNMYSRKTQTGGYPSLYAYWTSVLRKMG
jgi:hypothetical protein